MQDVPEIDVRDIQRLRLEPGDVLIYTTSVKLHVQQVDQIREQLRAIFGADVPVAVLSHDARLQVVNKNELESQQAPSDAAQIAEVMRKAMDSPGRVVGVAE